MVTGVLFTDTTELTPGIPIETITIDSAGLTKFAEIDIPTRAAGIAWDKAMDNFYIKVTRQIHQISAQLSSLLKFTD